jgi:hypothetical protein
LGVELTRVLASEQLQAISTGDSGSQPITRAPKSQLLWQAQVKELEAIKIAAPITNARARFE